MKQNDLKKMIQTENPRCFRWMPTLDFYVLREYLVPFSALLFAFCVLFLIGDVFNDLNDFLDSKSSVTAAFRYFIIKMPGNIRFILPITVLLACMYTLANFGRHREITAMRASGISLFRCCVPIYCVAFIVMLVNFWFNEKLVPDCETESERIIKTLDNPLYEIRRKSQLLYHSSDKLRSWYFGRFDEDGNQENVRLKIFRRDSLNAARKIPARMIEAERAVFVPNSGWNFYNVRVNEFTEQGLPGKTWSPESGKALHLSEQDLPERPEIIMKFIILPENLSSFDILEILRENRTMPPNLKQIYQTILYNRLAFPWVCFLCAFLALPLAARNERAGIFTAIISAVIVIVIYQVLTEIFLVAGKSGILPPIVAGLAPTIGFALYGWFFLIKKSM